MIDFDATVTITDDVVTQELEEEVLLLSLSSAEYFGLNETGSFIWRLLEGSPTVKDVCARVTDAFDVSADVARQDVLALLEQLHAEGMIACRAAGESTS
jgi:hypothetical protein